MSFTIRSLLAALSVGSPLAAQARWQLAPPMLGIRHGHAMAFDAVRGRTVLFGGQDRTTALYDETWEWDGNTWTRITSQVRPPARWWHSMAFDAQRNRIVLFGGLGSDFPAGDTWEWDGAQWQLRRPSHAPVPQYGHAMAFDPIRRQVVLLDISGGFWGWTGDDWQQITAATRPAVRWNASLATDTTRGRVVLFGGRSASTLLADTWEWDGANWQERPVGVAPPARDRHILLEAPNGVVLFGGYDAMQLDDTWSWDGRTWTQQVSGPFAGPLTAGAFDRPRQRTVLFGGSGGPGDHTWEWDGTAWSLRDPGPPRERQFHAMAYDPVRRRTVLFGGYGVSYLDDTWEWDGLRWHRKSPVHSPGFRHGHAMAFASNAGHVVLFGGNYEGLHLGDTWLWDGTDWRQVACSRAPAPRADHRMTWHPVRQRVLLFGGGRDMATYGDLWEWDGTCWTQQTAAAPLPTRASHIQAFEPTTGRLLIAGGWASSGFLADTWAWDGTSWAQLQALTPGFMYMSSALDLGRGRIVVHGGYTDGQFYRDQTLEFHQGTGWVETTRSGPSGRYGSAMAYHQATGRIVLFAGVENDLRTGFEFTRDTWELVPDHLARWTSYGAGCAGPVGTPQLQLWRDQLPWLGEPFVLRLLRLPPGQATLLWLGASDTVWGAVPLPLDLTPIGMPGCSLRMSPDLAFPLFQWTGEAALSVGIPNDPVLRGSTFYAQGLAVDPRANALGLVISDAGAATVGTR